MVEPEAVVILNDGDPPGISDVKLKVATPPTLTFSTMIMPSFSSVKVHFTLPPAGRSIVAAWPMTEPPEVQLRLVKFHGGDGPDSVTW